MEPTQIENWKRISHLGSGSFGVVSLWKNETTNEFIAIKKCKFQTDKLLTKRQKERWINEVEIMKMINHLNIIHFKELPKILQLILSKYNPNKLPMLSMEYCDKGNLRTVLKQVQNSSGLEEIEVRHIIKDITSAIYYLHNLNITHRDIKPENIVLKLESRLIYKIIDLGYAKEINGTVSFVGTFQYLAPEIMTNSKYNHSVDYWSLGVLIFEVITGFLPFLPQMNPFERYKYLERKQTNDIYIRRNQSGSIMTYSDLPKNNHISFCLKLELEIWLRRLLQFKSEDRLQTFPNNLNVFDHIQVILEKRIITVFFVYNLEFYSYEINESTLIGTLKDWICRDIKVGKNQLILITNLLLLHTKDDEFVSRLIGDDLIVYVFKSGDFTNDHKFDLPIFIRDLFNKCTEKLKWRSLRPIYIKCLFFIKQECRLLNTLMVAFKLFTDYKKKTMVLLEEEITKIRWAISDLLGKVEENNKKLELINKNQDYKEYLLNYQCFINNLKQLVNNFNKLVLEMNSSKIRQVNLLQEIKTLNDFQPEKNFQAACALIEKSNSETGDLPYFQMINIISQTIKVKDKLLNDKNFVDYAKATSVALKDTATTLDWIQKIQICIKELVNEFDCINRQKMGFATPNGLIEDCFEEIIKENVQLRLDLREKIDCILEKKSLILEEIRDCVSLRN